GLTSFFGLVSTDLGSLLDGGDPAADLFSVGPFVDMPVFQSGRGVANVDVAEAQLLQAELAYRRGVLLAYREVADALIVNDKVRGVIEESRVRSEAAARLLVLQEKRYRAGVVSYFEVLDAQRQLFLAETELVRSRVTQLQAYVELYRALGGGWTG
ncbi:MAG TPA: TolC family protein, partial [Steroidobacteraceae bacterium]